MKNIKFLAVAMFACVSMFATAAVTAKVNIKVKGKLADEILIVQDDAVVANFANSNNAIKTMNTANSWCLNIYALNGATKLGAVANPTIDGLKLEFQPSSKESNYKMSFSDLVGTIVLSTADTSFVIDVNDTLSFSCTAAKQFTISMPYSRPVTAGQAGTICYPKAITAVTGGTLYELTGADDSKVYGDVVTFPTTAGKPYVFKADAAATELVMINTGADAAVQEAKGLVGTLVDTTTPEGAWGIMGNYVVKVAAGNALLANRAYIDMEDLLATGAPSRGRAIFMIQNTPTGMQLIDAPAMKEGKMIMNGRMVIVKDGKMFNAQGAAL